MHCPRAICGLTTTVLVSLLSCTGSIKDDLGQGGGKDPAGRPASEGGKEGVTGQGPGTSGPSGGPGVGTTNACPTACPGASPGAVRIWRLTNDQYDATVQDLLGTKVVASTQYGFTADVGGAGFANSSALGEVNEAQADAYRTAAIALAAEAVASHLDRVFPCSADKIADAACGKQFVTTFGKKAFRRPLEAEEVQTYDDLLEKLKGTIPVKTAVSVVIETFLQSPDFLFRTELGDGTAAVGSQTQLTSHETASALSYYFWNTMPPDWLLAAADQGALTTKEQVASSGRKLVDDSHAHGTVKSFYSQLFGYRDLSLLSRDETLFPGSTAQLASMQQEVDAFVDSVVFGAEPSLGTLLTASYTFANTPLASLYGASGASASTFARVELDKTQRAGILTQAGFLAIHATPLASSPPRRGKFVLENLLCQGVPAPPDNIDVVSVNNNDPAAPKTTRQKFQVHETDATCKGCHTIIDPFGFPFEAYDSMGAFRTQEHGISVDTTSTIAGHGTIDGPVRDAVDLAHKLAGSDDVRLCLARQTLRYALGRGDAPEDESYIQELETTFASNQDNLKELFVGMAASPAFLTRKVEQ